MKSFYLKIILGVFITGVLSSCSKDNIVVEKNNSTNWGIDKKIIDDDIRNRIGYDPRFEYVSFKETEIDAPMLSLGEIPLTGQNTYQVVFEKIGGKISEDLQVTINHDATLYEKIKGDYSGFELGDASLVKILQPTQTIAKGTESTTFDLTIDNNYKLDKKFVIPFSVKMNNENIKGIANKDYFVVKIFPEQIQLKPVSTEFEKTIFLKDGALSANSAEVGITFRSTKGMLSGVKIGLVRDDSVNLPDGQVLAPKAIEGTLPKVDFSGSEQTLNFNLDISKLKPELGAYVLPLRWLVYDSNGKSYELDNNKVSVRIGVKRKGLVQNEENSQGSHNEHPLGKLIKDKSNIAFSYYDDTDTGNDERMLDGDYNETTYFKGGPDQYLTFIFNSVKNIKSVRFKMKATHGMTRCYIYGAQDEDGYDLKEQGWADFTEQGEFYTITFREAIPVKHLYFNNFTSNTRGGMLAWFEIYEVDFYEE
ncbi:hypothetical protein CGC48_09515 [Capnocytophaga cynodegmi]|uniref:BT-3987-like N-terminal domain-containing protein n=1 Tax=Capnocytophaga cynodegmi TaxID=28189 RepID=A0A250EAT2_9FLAO|nr:DUF1735 domain-containing protein [Capnocytophaga cynodegmi]ATA68837.1 hypothetical protein CGC48_09515 [Capnocytophaga cynodegmi]